MLRPRTYLFCLLIAITSPTAADDTAARLNDLQFLGSHNSYKQALDRDILSIARPFNGDIEKLDYHHPPLTDQLNLGLRGLELDLFHDPEGGRFAKPKCLDLLRAAGYQPLSYDQAGEMLRPGFKVLHVQDVDFRSHNLTLKSALAELRSWSEANPQHLPVVVTMNLKQGESPIPGGPAALTWDRAALDRLDAVLREGLGATRLLTPDDVRGEAKTLNEAVRTRGWPALTACRGKFLLVMDEGQALQQRYLADHAGLQGRAMFTTSSPGEPTSAFLIINDPVRDESRIRELIQQGYFVRTRADAGTMEMRSGDYRRFEAAQRSGAQLISTDYYLPDWRIRPDFCIRFEQGKLVRPNPVRPPSESHAHER